MGCSFSAVAVVGVSVGVVVVDLVINVAVLRR